MILILADDLTGGMDAAAPFAARGREVRLRLRESQPTSPEAGSDAVAVDLACRHLPGPEAAALARATAAASDGPVRLFLKIDSTLRGPVVELARALAADGRPIVLAPAVPAQGRTVKARTVLVDGVPVARGPLLDDPRTPPFTGDPVAALAPLPVTMPDAATPADLDRIVAEAPEGALLVGAAGLAEALAKARFGPERPFEPPAAMSRRALVVVGSLHPSARAQVARLAAARPDLALLVSPEARGDPLGAEAHLADRAANLALERRPGVLVLAGGDTARAVLGRLGVGTLRVLGEAVPGLPCGVAEGAAWPFLAVTKAGGFGSADALLDLAEALRLRPLG